MADKALSSLTSIGTLASADTGDPVYIVSGGNSRQAALGSIPKFAGLEGTAGYHIESDTGGDPVWAGFTQDTGTAAIRTWQAKARERISPRDFGAVGDGSTDDTAAIQAAIEYAATLSNATDTTSVLDGVFVEIDCSGATWALGSSLTFADHKNIVMRGGRFKAVGTWAAETPMFDIAGTTSISIANLTFRDIQFDGDRKASGFSVENAPRCRFENIRGNRYLDYGFLFKDNTWGTCLIDPVLHEWDSDDANLEVEAQRLADGIRIDGALDCRCIGGFIGFNRRGVACLSGGYGFNFIGTHIYDSALVTPQEHDIVFADSTTNGMQFDHCYFDTGWVHLEGTANHVFRNCRFFRNDDIAPAGLTAYIHLEATAASQGLLLRLVDCYFDDSGGTSRPVFKLTESGGNTYVFNKGTFTDSGHDQWTNTLPVNMTCVGATNTPLYLRSTHATQSFLSFAALNTTVTPTIGADGNDYVIQQNSVERLRITDTGVRIPNEKAFVSRNAAGNGNVVIATVDSSNFVRAGSGASLYVFHTTPVPFVDSGVDLGLSSLRWQDIWATNATIQTSDPDLKMDIAPIPGSAVGMINEVDPITFRWKRKGKRYHLGFRAGDIKTALDKTGLDCAAYVRGDDGRESLRTAELIPILWKAVQELSVRCAALEAKIADGFAAS